MVELELPTLQERGVSEKQEMIDFLLTKIKKELKKGKKLTLQRDAKAAIVQYPFPGNVRELENLITHLYVFCDATVSITDLPHRIIKPTQFTTDNLNWKDNERELIIRALDFYEGNQTRANKALEYGSINTFKSKVRVYGL